MPHHSRMAESIAYDLFKKYTGKGAFALLSSLPDSEPKEFENTWRDFKHGFIATKSNDEFFDFMAENLGAFANTEGGVIVFGIVADSDNPAKVDAAHKVVLVDNPEQFVTRIKKVANEVINPPLHGFDCKAVLAKDGKGFVVLYIPEGKDKPYESLRNKDRFVGRFDDSIRRLSLSFVRQLFYPQSQSRFSLNVSTLVDQNIDSHAIRTQIKTASMGRFHYGLSITNTGIRTAHEVFVSITQEGGTVYTLNEGLSLSPFPRCFSVPVTLHPTFSANVTVYITYPRDRAETIYVHIFARDLIPQVAEIDPVVCDRERGWYAEFVESDMISLPRNSS